MIPQRPGILGEYTVLGTLYVVSPALDAATVSDRVHERVNREDRKIRAGASTLPNDSDILVRLLGHRAPDVNDGLYDAWDEIRQLIFGVNAPNQRKY
jgi:urease accessory protein